MTHHNARRLRNTFVALIAIVLSGMVIMTLWGGSAAVIPALLVLAVIKCRLVALDFMGLRRAPAGLRFGLLAWPVVLALLALAKLAMDAVLSA
ncbi:cytochrome C oxidase subunit IV family protein [Ensifer sp. 4252]|uniref:cytochrome C oxidase subunit IV family protein n=1 Tax=Ensifer sp. 4252 TaxID=3373915 RepID=UPI003D2229C8